MLLETVLLIILIAVNAYLAYLFLFKKDDKNQKLEQGISNLEKLQERTEKTLRDEMSISRRESSVNEKRIREEISNLFKGLGDVVERRLETIQKDNNEKLEKMRSTVEEKLDNTLDKRLGEKFKLVSNQLEQVYRGLGEMKNLATGVGDLKKVLSNIKTRGVWGEVQLENILSEVFTNSQYKKNVATKKGSQERVDFAITLPGRKDDSEILLPIDAKFPLEDYQKLIEAQEKGDLLLIDQFSKALEFRVKTEAKSIKEKYIDSPRTTDFAILFLATEGLYAEILKRPGLAEKIQREFRVLLTGPSTTTALLNSLQMGFRTLAIEKRSSEVWEILANIKTEFGTFADLLDKTHKKLEEATHTIESASSKSRTIEKRLNKVQQLPEGKSVKQLES